MFYKIRSDISRSLWRESVNIFANLMNAQSYRHIIMISVKIRTINCNVTQSNTI